jgi:hypothetical protein
MSVMKNYARAYSDKIREQQEHVQKRTTGWIQGGETGRWFYLRKGKYHAEVFKVCHSDTMQVRWAGQVYGQRGGVGQTFEDDYTARSVVETIVNLLVPPP